MSNDDAEYVADTFDGSNVDGMPNDADVICISETGVSGAYLASTISLSDYIND